MGLYDGPLFVGPNAFPVDANTTAADIYQIQSGGAALIHQELQMNYRMGFYDGHYWSADGKVYIIGGYRVSLSGWSDGVIWTWDGTTLTPEFIVPGSVVKDNYSFLCIEEFNGALYAAHINVPAGSPLGGVVFRKAAPGAPWLPVHSYAGTSDGPVYLKASGGQLVVVYDSRGIPMPNSFYYSPTGDPGSWIGEPWFNPAPNAEPRFTFYNGSEWVHTFAVSGFPPTFETWFSPALGGPWGGPVIILQGDCGRAYQGTVASDWYVMLANDPSVYKYAGAGNWVPWRTEVFNIRARIAGSPCDGGVHDGDVYTPMFASTNMSYAINLDPSIQFPDPNFFNPAAFISTPVGPPAWDILDIESSDWGTGPFCDEDTANTTVHAGSHLEITADKGSTDPAYYELSFGLTCPDLPDDWDLQLDLELDAIPRLHDDDEARLVISVHETNTSRKTAIQITSQGVAVYGMDEYSDLIPGSNSYVTDGEVTLKLTGLGTDPEQRSYLALESTLRYQRGFPSYLKTGSVDKLRIEAVGTVLKPTSVKVKAIRVRTHLFDPEVDPYSIDAVRPKAVIV
jgi:hypothetical protein